MNYFRKILSILSFWTIVFALLPVQAAFAQPARPGSTSPWSARQTQTILRPIQAQTKALTNAIINNIKNPPPPPQFLLQPYTTDPLNEGSPVSSSLAENVYVQIGGKTALQIKAHSDATVIAQGAIIKLPSTQTITDTPLLKFNVKVDADTVGHFNTALSSLRGNVIYSTPPNFTDEQFAVAGISNLPGPPINPNVYVIESDGSYTITFPRTRFLVDPNYIHGLPFIPVGSRIKKIGIAANTGFNNAVITWTIKDVFLNNTAVGFNLNSGTIFESPWLPYDSY